MLPNTDTDDTHKTDTDDALYGKNDCVQNLSATEFFTQWHKTFDWPTLGGKFLAKAFRMSVMHNERKTTRLW